LLLPRAALKVVRQQVRLLEPSLFRAEGAGSPLIPDAASTLGSTAFAALFFVLVVVVVPAVTYRRCEIQAHDSCAVAFATNLQHGLLRS
jgi:hypothetical protein